MISHCLSLTSEKLFMAMADRLAEDGFKDVGYQYINIDVSLVAYSMEQLRGKPPLFAGLLGCQGAGFKWKTPV